MRMYVLYTYMVHRKSNALVCRVPSCLKPVMCPLVGKNFASRTLFPMLFPFRCAPPTESMTIFAPIYLGAG